MAEQDTDHHHKAEGKEEETQPTNMDRVSPFDESKQKETDIALNLKQQLSDDSAASFAPMGSETNNDSGKDMEQHDVKKESSPSDEDTMLNIKEKSTLSQADEESHGDYNTEKRRNEQLNMTAEEISKDSSAPDVNTVLNVKENSPALQADEESHGDYSTEKPRNEQPTVTAEISEEPSAPDEDTKPKENSTPLQADERSHGDYSTGKPRNEQPNLAAEKISRGHHTREEKEPETTSSPTLGDRSDRVDGPDKEIPDTDNTNAEAGEGDGSCPEKVVAPEEEEERTSFPQAQTRVETIGPTIQEAADAEPAVPVVQRALGGNGMYLLAGVLVLVAILMSPLLQPESPPQKDDVRQIDIFLRQLEKVKTQFPNQRAELWNRSKIHLLRHLQTAQPTEPVSLILTAGHRAEKTLHCLAQSLASAFSSALNASVLHIDGASKASQDSDQVKLDIDSKLQGAFEGDKPVAVINRFEELPPGSTLIFYRYCDHENAAYKKTCLIFTVLLGEEEEIPAETRLSTVEEMVDDHLQKKFLSDEYPVSFDKMDIDKYGGLWSRISHLILPVAADGRIEHEGCSGT
ncbi:torsin-1A-interacting protein 2-like isoform X1 [Epinephelus lanceolatus]|uniref:torsin-1A-interacting protein 2-like isoform X1 n=1 Tax=Epinephelus lanceolatus TaxID=310571 RepID=UPI001446058C|nr:torsin-1A-interacting protein 2-like isoform X1 [Epinephelus lanceolatus]XP_033478519.1 torsin-1A-interacting protein 2-like isoform X1 [Epinephelus lanceolatus]